MNLNRIANTQINEEQNFGFSKTNLFFDLGSGMVHMKVLKGSIIRFVKSKSIFNLNLNNIIKSLLQASGYIC